MKKRGMHASHREGGEWKVRVSNEEKGGGKEGKQSIALGLEREGRREEGGIRVR